MKKIFLTLMVLSLAFASQAQFHVELGPSFQSPSGDFADTYDLGVGFSIEPRVVLSDKMAVGLYIGALGFAGGDLTGSQSVNSSIDAAALTPILGTFTYKILDSKVTPYVGAGLGLYSGETATLDASNTNIGATESSSDFGFTGRAGVFLGRLNLGASYHSAGDISFMQFALGVRIGPW